MKKLFLFLVLSISSSVFASQERVLTKGSVYVSASGKDCSLTVAGTAEDFGGHKHMAVVDWSGSQCVSAKEDALSVDILNSEYEGGYIYSYSASQESVPGKYFVYVTTLVQVLNQNQILVSKTNFELNEGGESVRVEETLTDIYNKK